MQIEALSCQQPLNLAGYRLYFLFCIFSKWLQPFFSTIKTFIMIFTNMFRLDDHRIDFKPLDDFVSVGKLFEPIRARSIERDQTKLNMIEEFVHSGRRDLGM